MNEINEYIDTVFSLLDRENFFEKAGLFMDRDIFRNFLAETLEDNLNKNGSFLLMENQFEEIVDKTSKFIIEETFCDLIQTGDIRPVGIDENGDFLYESVNK